MKTLWMSDEVLVTTDDGHLLGTLWVVGSYLQQTVWEVRRLHGPTEQVRVPIGTPSDRVASGIDWMDPKALPSAPKAPTRRTKKTA